MDLIKVKTLFKCLLVAYMMTLLALIQKISDEPRNAAIELGESQLLNLSMKTRNITKLVYVNRTKTEIVYRDKIQIRYTEKQKYGPGENGTKVEFDNNLLPVDAVQQIEDNKKFHGFNTFVSDIVNLRRKLKDVRPKACKEKIYPEDMPPASVVIIFRDEWHSILLRTVYSVFEHSPEHLLKEIILVDDGSKNADLKAKIEVHVATVEKLKLVRNPQSLGLMMARQKGIEATSADYFIVMDGHMEVNEGWLEPLIYRLQQSPNSLLCSHVGAIQQDTMEYVMDEPELEDPLFDRTFPFFDHISLDQVWAYYRPEFRKARHGSIAPLQYGTIQGMMTVMRKEFFMQLGGFDPGMKVWGSEQIELSVKVWLCGGQVEMIPCSKVAHMYRITPWGGYNASNDYHSINKHRMTEVWMDGPQLDLMRDVLSRKTFYPGDISDRVQIRTRNQCKPYQYYLDIIRGFSKVFIPDRLVARGPIYTRYMDRCMDCAKINGTFQLILYACNNNSNQYFLHTMSSQIRTIQGALLNARNDSVGIEMVEAMDEWFSDSSVFKYQSDKTIRTPLLDRCITAVTQEKIALRQCNGRSNQEWEWTRLSVNEEREKN